MLKPLRPLRVAVLCSRRAPGLAHLIAESADRSSPFKVVCVISSEPDCPDVQAARVGGVDVVSHPIADFYAARGSSLYRDFVTRRAYDRETAERLSTYAPDIVLLAGYLFLVTRPLLEAFEHRMLNLHFSDLTIRLADGRPAYVGPRAVRHALADGLPDTAATVHLVDAEPDGGPPLVRSEPYPVSPMVKSALAWDALDMFRAYAFAHQEWMMRSASGPLLRAALELVASGAVDLDRLAERDPAAVVPWLVDQRGRLTPPAAVHIYERLKGYQRATA